MPAISYSARGTPGHPPHGDKMQRPAVRAAHFRAAEPPWFGLVREVPLRLLTNASAPRTKRRVGSVESPELPTKCEVSYAAPRSAV